MLDVKAIYARLKFRGTNEGRQGEQNCDTFSLVFIGHHG